MSNDKSTEDFEAYAITLYKNISLEKDGDEYRYALASTGLRWWQASRKALEAEQAQQVAVPVKREPLSDDEIADWFVSENGLEHCSMCAYLDFQAVIRAVEARHGIKAAPQGDKK